MTNSFLSKPLIWDTNDQFQFTFTHGNGLAYWAQELDDEEDLKWWYVQDGSPFTYAFTLGLIGYARLVAENFLITPYGSLGGWTGALTETLFLEGFNAPFTDDPAKGPATDEINLSLPLDTRLREVYTNALGIYDNYLALDYHEANSQNAINFVDFVSEIIWDVPVLELAVQFAGLPQWAADWVPRILDQGMDAVLEILETNIFTEWMADEIRDHVEPWLQIANMGTMAAMVRLADLAFDGELQEVLNDLGDNLFSGWLINATALAMGIPVLPLDLVNPVIIDIFPATPPSDLTFMSLPMSAGALDYPLRMVLVPLSLIPDKQI